MRSYLPVSYSEVNFKISKTSLFIYLLGFVIILAVYLQPYVPVEQLTKDTVVVSKGKFYHGLISNFGLFLWCSAAVVCFFTFLLLKNTSNIRHKKMVLFGSLMSVVLLLDDYLMLHEHVFPIHLGLSENYILILYPLMLVSFVVYFLKEILLSQVLLFFSALGCLGLSMITDKILNQHGSVIILEDGFKLLGIMGWAAYFFHTCLLIAQQRYTYTTGNNQPLDHAITNQELAEETVSPKKRQYQNNETASSVL